MAAFFAEKLDKNVKRVHVERALEKSEKNSSPKKMIKNVCEAGQKLLQRLFVESFDHAQNYEEKEDF